MFDAWDEILQGVSTEIPDDAALTAFVTDASVIAVSEFGNMGSADITSAADTALADRPTPGSEIAGTGPTAATGGAESQTAKLAQQILGPQEDPADVTRSSADVARGASGSVMGSAAQPESKGIIGGAMDWVKNNQTLAAIAGTGIAGALGGAGKAALEKEIALRNIQARKDLLTQQTSEQQRLSREGTYTGKPGVATAGKKVLYRADGTPVYVGGGLINGQMNP